MARLILKDLYAAAVMLLAAFLLVWAVTRAHSFGHGAPPQQPPQPQIDRPADPQTPPPIQPPQAPPLAIAGPV